jgi:hypothetical protein
MLPDESIATELGPPAGRVKIEIGVAFPFDVAANCKMDVSLTVSWTTYTLMAALGAVKVGSSVVAAPRALQDPQTVIAATPITITMVALLIKGLESFPNLSGEIA